MAVDGRRFYIGGAWVEPLAPRPHEVGNPAPEPRIGTISLGDVADVDSAVAAARGAFDGWSRTSREERIALLESIARAYEPRVEELAQAVTAEMGSPIAFSRSFHAAAPLGLIAQT